MWCIILCTTIIAMSCPATITIIAWPGIIRRVRDCIITKCCGTENALGTITSGLVTMPSGLATITSGLVTMQSVLAITAAVTLIICEWQGITPVMADTT